MLYSEDECVCSCCRPPKPGAGASPTPLDGASIAAGMMSSKAEAQAPAKAAETFVDDILAGAQESARQARSPAQPPKKVAARRKASKEWTAEQYEQFDNLLNGADVDAAGQAGKGAFMSGSQDASAPRQTAAPSIKESGLVRQCEKRQRQKGWGAGVGSQVSKG